METVILQLELVHVVVTTHCQLVSSRIFHVLEIAADTESVRLLPELVNVDILTKYLIVQ